MITVSIVSHSHGKFLPSLVDALHKYSEVEKIIITINIPEKLNFLKSSKVNIIQNTSPKGFGENHNNAFHKCQSEFFCVLNPDIFFIDNPFPTLIDVISNPSIGVVAPLVYDSDSVIEDSFRNFPTVHALILKLFFSKKDFTRYENLKQPFSSDWVAGMFMLFKKKTFATLGGFDQKFFLYYEDVDICARAWKMNMEVYVAPTAKIIHFARRQSHKNVKFFLWHLQSFIRYRLRYLTSSIRNK